MNVIDTHGRVPFGTSIQATGHTQHAFQPYRQRGGLHKFARFGRTGASASARCECVLEGGMTE